MQYIIGLFFIGLLGVAWFVYAYKTGGLFNDNSNKLDYKSDHYKRHRDS